jgi:hypothetical protein
VRKIALGSAALLAASLTLPSALAGPSGPTEPPTCGSTDVVLSISPTVLWPPNHKMVPVSITASDQDGDGDMVSVMIGTITNSDETNPPNPQEITGTGQPDTSATSDQQGSDQSAMFTDSGSHTFTVDLAAERSGHDTSGGRTYSIPVTCTESGMGEMRMDSATMKVLVPHDKGHAAS